MKNVSCLLTLALIIGCGGGEQQAPTPEKEAEMNSKMDGDMQKMMGDMKTMPGTPGTEAKE